MFANTSLTLHLSHNNPLSSKLVLSDFDKDNPKRGYNGKCKHCPRVWFKLSNEMQDKRCESSDADETLAYNGMAEMLQIQCNYSKYYCFYFGRHRCSES